MNFNMMCPCSINYLAVNPVNLSCRLLVTLRFSFDLVFFRNRKWTVVAIEVYNRDKKNSRVLTSLQTLHNGDKMGMQGFAF